MPAALDAIARRALERNAEGRYPTARELAIAIEEAVPLASPRAVGEWVERLKGSRFERRRVPTSGSCSERGDAASR